MPLAKIDKLDRKCLVNGRSAPTQCSSIELFCQMSKYLFYGATEFTENGTLRARRNILKHHATDAISPAIESSALSAEDLFS